MIAALIALVVTVLALYHMDNHYTEARRQISRGVFKLLDENRDLRRERDSLKVQLGRCLEALHEKEVA
jgi:hypothetical protein